MSKIKFNIGDMVYYRFCRGEISRDDDFGIITEKKTFDGARNIAIYWRKPVDGDNLVFYRQSDLRERIQNVWGTSDQWILIPIECVNE